MIAVIQAGGKGTRLAELTKNLIPKPLVLMNGKPMIEWQLENLKQNGVSEFVFIIGHLGEKIQDYFGDGSRWEVKIDYISETEPLGSAGSLFFLKDKVLNQDILLIFGDVMFDVDFGKMVAFHKQRNSLATLFVHPNSHPYDSDLITLDAQGKVIGFEGKNTERNGWYDNCVNAGLYVLSGAILNRMNQLQRMDLEKDFLFPISKESGQVYGYRSPEYVKDAGTVERFQSVERDFRSGLAARKNLRNKQKGIFLDRDGTVNKSNGLIYTDTQFELEDNAAEAIENINKSEYLAIVITNQPVVARGLCGIEEVEQIHRKMSSLLGEKGAYLDDIKYCPHHPDKGYPEENPEYKVVCNCRKPKTGMIDEIADKYHIDLRESYFIGDTTIDIQTGINAGLTTILVKTGEAGTDHKYNCKADFIADDILEAVKIILKTEDMG